MVKRTRNILILDDDEAVRESLQDFFEDQGWQVTTAVTAEKALKMAPGHEWNAAVVDIRLPGMDGTTFIREVSALQPNMVCLIYTGSPQYRLPADILSLPQVCDQALAKPVGSLFELEKALLRQMELFGQEGPVNE